MTSNAEKKDNGREMTTLLSRENWHRGQRQTKRQTENIITILYKMSDFQKNKMVIILQELLLSYYYGPLEKVYIFDTFYFME